MYNMFSCKKIYFEVLTHEAYSRMESNLTGGGGDRMNHPPPHGFSNGFFNCNE